MKLWVVQPSTRIITGWWGICPVWFDAILVDKTLRINWADWASIDNWGVMPSRLRLLETSQLLLPPYISLGNCGLMHICLSQLKQRPCLLGFVISTLVRCLNQAFGGGAKSSEGGHWYMRDSTGVAWWVMRVNILVNRGVVIDDGGHWWPRQKWSCNLS